MKLLSATITAAAAAAAGEVFTLPRAPRNLTIQANFVYGSGGTNATAYVQTSLDNGETWTDIACFQFTTASARKIVNLSAQTAVTTQVTPTDGAMTANTAQDGVLGPRFRVKKASTGTYAGGTTLNIDVQADQIQPGP